MGNIRLYGSTSGYTELAPPAVAPDGVLALPSGTGTLATQAYVDTAETDAINTAIAGSGLVHINTTTFTTSAAVNVNNVFTSTYDNYYILVTRTAGSSTTMRMRAAGTDNSAAEYELYGYYGGAAQGNDNISANTSWNIAAGSGVAMFSLILVNPFAASKSFGVAQLHSVNIGQSAAVVHDVASSFDGFSINGTSQTGTIRVYGYKNS
jgi:hypothetical protein